MKRLVVFAALMGVYQISVAQTWAELFQQKKTYRKYSIITIANNEIYLQYLKQGYNIYKDGTKTWNNIKNGDFGQHTTYFNSLKAVSPGVAKYPKIKGCGDFQSGIMQEYTKGKKEFPSAKFISAAEKNYINKVYENLMEECSKSMDELNMMVTSNKVEMSDDERIKNIDRIYDDYREKYSFILDFNNSTRILNLSRQKENGQNGTLKELYGN